MTADLCIQNARIVAGLEMIEACVSVDAGKIIKVGRKSGALNADETIDAKGMLLLPGLIDVHVHFRDPGETQKEDWVSGSKAAAAGGVTTVLDMPNNRPNPTVDLNAVSEKKKQAKKKSIVNYGIYAGVTSGNVSRLPEIAPHVCGFKLFMGETTGSLALEDEQLQRKAFEAVAGTGKPLVVHAEDARVNKKFFEQNKGKDDVFAHSRAHPQHAETKAIERVVEFVNSSGARAHITHISTGGGAELVHKSKTQGTRISCDTSCNYLLLNQGNLQEKGAYLKMTPPLRTPKDQEALWNAVNSHTLDLIASDHAPHTREDKEKGIWEAASGVPGVGLTLPLLFTEVDNKRLTLNRLIELTSQNPAKLFKIKNKGYIMEGFDADLILIDPKTEKTVSVDDLYSKAGWSPFEGWSLSGWPQVTIVGGNRVYDDGIIFDGVKGREVKQLK